MIFYNCSDYHFRKDQLCNKNVNSKIKIIYPFHKNLKETKKINYNLKTWLSRCLIIVYTIILVYSYLYFLNVISCNVNSELTSYKGIVRKLSEKCKVNEKSYESFIDLLFYGKKRKKEESNKNKVLFNWELCKYHMSNRLGNANEYSIGGVNYKEWDLHSITNEDYNASGGRNHKMFSTVISSKRGFKKKKIKLFIKKVPLDSWIELYNMMNIYHGEFLEGGENFVMEAMVSLFLNKYYPGITPKFYNLLYESENDYSELKGLNELMFCDIDIFKNELIKIRNRYKNGYIVMIWKFYGQNLREFLDSEKENLVITKERKIILYECLKLINKLHKAGLAHLDISPENILIGENYEMRLCDFGKTTPLYVNNNINEDNKNHLQRFRSYLPYVGKIRYKPPECWNIKKKYMTLEIKNPLRYIKSLKDYEYKETLYFDVLAADIYMLGILFIWISSNRYLWGTSDMSENNNFVKFVNSGMNFDIFPLTREWPDELKYIIKKLLDYESRKSLDLNELIKHPWWSTDL
ncbi:serine/threonine protein kinase, FIKK family [Plasmodium gaboni]|uniref:non-specific serine/threonine protein kinase n=1 Tax=Plasmodium gaboni TaxID=647221 RepID=A0ABY0KXP3_9APIC|nr:serine/threonine protein kinase, FIKK family [Plasmodium gaboni]